MFLSKLHNLVTYYLGLPAVIIVVSLECFLSGSHCSQNPTGFTVFTSFSATLSLSSFYR